jgi:hypothetical protein
MTILLGRAMVVGFLTAESLFAAAQDFTNTATLTQPPPLETPRDFYNAGAKKIREGKFNDAEPLLQTAMAKQDERVQPVAVYDLGHVRFAQGAEELKKSPSPGANKKRSSAAVDSGGNAIQQGEEALASNDVDRIVSAYVAGRGSRKELRAATKAVQRAMETYGKTLLKWRRSLGDFTSATELNPSDTNAAANAQTVERAIAKLVDSVREMQAMKMSMGSSQSKLDQVLQALKGRIPADKMPPGAPGEEDEEDVMPDSLKGMKEAQTQGGKEMEVMLSPEEAGELLNGFKPDGKFLPMSDGDQGKSKDRNRKPW